MKALMPLKKKRITEASASMIRHQVSLECNKVCKQYEILEDVCWLYTIAEETGFRKKRLERIYRAYWKHRDEVQEFVRNGEDKSIEDGLREIYMAQALRRYGLDVEAMYNELGKGRIDYVITN